MRDYKKTTVKDWINTPTTATWRNISLIVAGLYVWYQIIIFFAK